MPKVKIAFAAVLSILGLAACGSPEPATDNDAAPAEIDASENAGSPAMGRPGESEEPGGDPVPPPDAVSHPDGYLPDAGDPPAPSAPEPGTADPPSSKEAPPATEDEYMRNKQAGR